MGECSYSSSSQRRDPLDDSGIRLCKTSPKFLESNATSHTWVFSAMAELIDNAYDPDVRATQFHIDHRDINGHTCLVFIDNGNGLNEEQLYRMLSFGYSDKPENHEYKPIGRYGNGFKSGSMRLGKDAIVLTKQASALSIGFLSQTYHERINADTVRIPIVILDRETLELADPLAQNRANLDAILKHSIFESVDDLIDQLTILPDFDPSSPCGTKIIIWNLRKLGQHRLELCFRSDIKDIVYNDPDFYSGPSAAECEADQLDYEHSLRKYCSILYLQPRMKIFIMGQKVRSRLIAKDLCNTVVDKYKMQGQSELQITFGFNPARGHTDSSNDYGIVMYHKNRLIKAYEKVGYQKQANSGQGYGVVGVVEVDYLTPSHNKQNFNTDEKYHRVMNALGKKLNEYWDTKMASRTNGTILKEEYPEPDCTWVQCDECLKWRRLPDGFSPTDFQDSWYCSMHPNEEIANVGCRALEDKLDQGEVDINIQYTYRKQKNEIAKKRKSFAAPRNRSLSGAESYQDPGPSKRRREDDQRRTAMVNSVRQKVEELNRRAQSLLAATPGSVGEVAEAIHRHVECNRDDDESRTVLCVKCHTWRKLPTGTRVTDTASWECAMHPDESQRECHVADHDESMDHSPVTDDEMSNDVPSAPVNISINGENRQDSRCASAEVELPTNVAIVSLDSPADDNESVDEVVSVVRVLEERLDAATATMDAVAKRAVDRSRRVTVNTVNSSCQTENTGNSDTVNCTTHAETQTEACAGCEAEREKLEEARRQVARLLNILLESAIQIRPENALETVATLIRDEERSVKKE